MALLSEAEKVPRKAVGPLPHVYSDLVCLTSPTRLCKGFFVLLDVGTGLAISWNCAAYT